MNSAVIFVKSRDEKVLSNSGLDGKSVIERTIGEIKEVGIDDIYVIGTNETIDGTKNAKNILEVANLIDVTGKCLLVSPLYDNLDSSDFRKMLDVKDGGAVLSENGNVTDIFMVPSRDIINFQNISYTPIEINDKKIEKVVEKPVEEDKKPSNELSETMVFALTANVDLVNEVCGYLHLDQGKVQVNHFADGEILVEIGESVRGKKVFVVQSTCKPTNEKLMELLIFVDALKRSSAAEINCIIPYYGYARQDRKAKPRQPITAKLVASLIETAGANRVITFDLHATQIQGFFNFPVDELTVIPMMAQYFKKKNFDPENLVVVSPDHGGVARARNLAERLDAPIAIVDKRRPRPNVCEAQNVIGDVEGKDVIVVDDICDTAGSLVASCDILRKHGARDIYVSISHGVFSGQAIDRIENSVIKEIVVANTIPLSDEVKAKTNKITVLSIGWMVSKLIAAISNHTAVSEVYNLFED